MANCAYWNELNHIVESPPRLFTVFRPVASTSTSPMGLRGAALPKTYLLYSLRVFSSMHSALGRKLVSCNKEEAQTV